MINLDDFQSLRWLKTIVWFAILLALIWTLILALSLAWNLNEQQRVLNENALIMARTAFQKDVLYRSWNAGHGGVYVPVTETTQPNPYLADRPEQNIETVDGRLFTLINPAYMSRQVFELQEDYTGILGHITSLNPIRPENAADTWETRALQAFEAGEKEYFSVERLNDAPYLRYMSPLMVEERCLKCHAVQGYQVGQVRGGISESVPLAPLQAANRSFTSALILGYLAIWSGGLAGIVFFTNRLRASLNRQVVTEKKLVELSTYDGLTGVYNRGYFEESLRKIDLLQGKPISMLSADVDDLKKTNDRFGHEAGDRLLVRAAQVLKNSFRETDFVARTGGDEFIILLPNTNEEQANLALERVRKVMEKANQDHPDQTLHISLGIATTGQDIGVAEAIRLADQRMYADKAAYKQNRRAD